MAFDKFYFLLGGLLLVGGLIFIFYNNLYVPGSKKSYTLLSGTQTISQDFESTVPYSLLAPNRDSLMVEDSNETSGTGSGYGLSFTWSMYLEQVGPERIWSTSYAKDKPILRIGDSPHIVYNPKYNILKVIVNYKESPFYAHYPVIELRDLPLQTWNQYGVVIDNNKVKIYFNGKLVVNKVLATVPVIEATDITIGEKFNNLVGKIKDLTVYFRPYDNREISKIL
jgi:hypothetical protein